MATVKALEVSDLTCLRGGRVVFRDVALSVHAGEMLALEGPNGSGKTSLLRMIAGFLAPATGTIRLRTNDGGEISDGEERGKFAGWLGHHDAAKPQLTARETLRFFADLNGRDPSPKNSSQGSNFSTLPQGEGRIEAALDAVGLGRARDLPCQYLSAGQKKRLALARLRMSGRSLWLLDEPLAALDAAGKTLAAELVKAHCAAGGIAIAATHEPLGLDGLRLALA